MKRQVYFSDFFNLKPDIIEDYGAFNISLINDLPLFIDPFLLFNSNKNEYQEMHKEILHYVSFLRDQSISMKAIGDGLLRSWYCFPEVKQTWLGYSKIGNRGRGVGLDFARALHYNLHQVFSNFGDTSITRSSHIEKLCLIKENTGRDNISDFVTNLIKRFLLEYTQYFALNNIDKIYLKEFPIKRVSFNYRTFSWNSGKYRLPAMNVSENKIDYVLLTPKDLLTKDDVWINKKDLIDQFGNIVTSIENDELREQLNYYFLQSLPKKEYTKQGKEKTPKRKEIAAAVYTVVSEFPHFLDYYIKYKEDNGDRAKSVSEERVEEVYNLFVSELSEFGVNQRF